MTLPPYVTLAILATCLFIASSLSIMVTHGLNTADIRSDTRSRFGLKFACYIVVWLGLVLGFSYTNTFVASADQTFPLLGAVILGSAFLGNILLATSETATQILKSLPLHFFATVQIYRTIGIVFLMMQSDGLLSAYFASSTGWGDIFVGVTAPIVGLLLWKDAYRYRFVGLAWCIIGILDLLLVLYKGINSAPGPLQTTSLDLPTVAIGYFPFPVIPLLVVPISLILHVQMMRKLAWLKSPRVHNPV